MTVYFSLYSLLTAEMLSDIVFPLEEIPESKPEESHLKMHIDILNAIFLVLYNSQVMNTYLLPSHGHINIALRSEESIRLLNIQDISSLYIYIKGYLVKVSLLNLM